MNKIAIVVISILAFLAGIYAAYLVDVPLAVREKYRELSVEYANSLGAKLSECTKGDQLVYVVEGNGGISGISFYYHGNGRTIGSEIWTDVLLPPGQSLPPPPIDLTDFTCDVMADSYNGTESSL